MNTNSRLPYSLLITIAILSILSLLVSVGTYYRVFIHPTPTPTPTLTPTPTETPTPTPTFTPTSTSTPTPTPTPTPTSTPTPTPTPQRVVITVHLFETGTILIEPAEVAITHGDQAAISANIVGSNLEFEWSLDGPGALLGNITSPYITYSAPEGEKEKSTTAEVSVKVNVMGRQIVEGIVFHVVPPPTPIPTDTPTPTPTPTDTPIPTPAPIAMRLGAVAVPAGWMSGGSNPADFISLEDSPGDCHVGSDCLRVTYRTGGGWGGVLWWPYGCGYSGTADAWDRVNQRVCGINVLAEGNFSTVHRLTFWARGDQGGEKVKFEIGGNIPPSPGRSLGPVTLGPTWEHYEISLSGMNLTNAIALFLWVATDEDNPRGAVFYLDGIQFEGMQ